MLPPTSPLKCTEPSEVYTLLKSSDFVLHDLDETTVFDGCEMEPHVGSVPKAYELELVLRKWYPVDRSRELRCFVRRETLLGMYLMGIETSLSQLTIFRRYLPKGSQLL